MKNTLTVGGTIILLIFSFLYIDKINNILIENNSLYQEILSRKDIYEIDPSDAAIAEGGIMPGVSGKRVNVLESYYNMRSLGVFNSSYLVYKIEKPLVSISDNKNLYITSGNKNKRNISFIIDKNYDIESYIKLNNIRANKLITYNDFESDNNFEYLNNDVNNFNRLNSKILTKICLVNNDIEEYCKSHGYYLINANIKINNDNYILVKEELSSGNIILIDNDLNLDYFIMIYIEALYRDYNIVYLSELLYE